MAGSVLSDTEGAIAAFLVVVKSDAWRPTDSIIVGLANAFPEASFWVQSYSLYSSNTSIGGVFGENKDRLLIPFIYDRILASWRNAGFSSKTLFREWLVKNLPYSDSFSSVVIVDSNGVLSVIDLSALSIDKRLKESLKIHKLFPSLKFTFDQNRLGCWEGLSSDSHGRIQSNISADSKLSSRKLTVRAKALNEFNEVVNQYKLNWDERLALSPENIVLQREIYWNLESTPGRLSILTVGGQLTSWPQDQFIVRKETDGFEVRLKKPLIDDVDLDDAMRKYCGLTFAANEDFLWKSDFDKLKIHGGNMHVSGNLVFVGRDAVKEYVTPIEWETASFSWENIKLIILHDVFGTTVGKHLIWIGLTERSAEKDEINLTFQPVYHTDLFFQPFGFFVNDKGMAVFRYIFSQPQILDVLPPLKGSLPPCIDALTSRFRETYQSIEAQLHEIGVVSEPIFIRLPIQFKVKDSGATLDWSNPIHVPIISRFWSFANGLINRKANELQFVVFHHSDPEVPEMVLKAQKEAFKKIQKSILGLTIVPIRGKELANDSKGGLRCAVKVLARSFKEVHA